MLFNGPRLKQIALDQAWTCYSLSNMYPDVTGQKKIDILMDYVRKQEEPCPRGWTVDGLDDAMTRINFVTIFIVKGTEAYQYIHCIEDGEYSTDGRRPDEEASLVDVLYQKGYRDTAEKILLECVKLNMQLTASDRPFISVDANTMWNIKDVETRKKCIRLLYPLD